MKATDARAAAKMMQALAVFHGDESKVTAQDLVAACLGRKKLASVLLAFAGTKPVGFSETYDWMNFVLGMTVRHIDQMFVDEKYRQCGIGSKLVKAITKDSIKSGCVQITVGATKDNEAANNFYKKLGFEERQPRGIRYVLTNLALI
jgi:ribosomal protein S18 acetylase RimI-like enzyme